MPQLKDRERRRRGTSIFDPKTGKLETGRCLFERESPNGVITVRFQVTLRDGTTRSEMFSVYPDDENAAGQPVLEKESRLGAYLEMNLDAWAEQVLNGRIIQKDARPATTTDLVRWWRDHKSGRISATPTNLTPEYVEKEAQRLGLLSDNTVAPGSFLDRFGSRDPESLTRKEVFTGWLKPRMAQGAEDYLTWRSAKNIHSTIRAVYNGALEASKVTVPPPSPKKFPAQDRFQKGEARERILANFLTPEELAAYRRGVKVVRKRYQDTGRTGLMYCAGKDKKTGRKRYAEVSPYLFERTNSMIEWTVRLGTRPGETCGLRDSAINPRTGLIDINAALGQLYRIVGGNVEIVKQHLGPTKTGESASYSLRILQGENEHWLAQRDGMSRGDWFHEGKSHDGYIFPSQSGGPLSDKTFRNQMAKILGAMAEEFENVRYISPYGLRHTCGVHLRLEGADRQYIMDYLRHTNYETTQKYVKWADMITGQQADFAVDALGTKEPKVIQALEDARPTDELAERRPGKKAG